MLDLHQIARALGGVVSNGQVLCPGPGHSIEDRSLSIKLHADKSDIIAHSFAGDDDIVCKDYAREKIGLPAFQPNGSGRKRPRSTPAQIAQLFKEAAQNSREVKPGQLVATFDYEDSSGVVRHRVLKYDNPRSFRQCAPDGQGGWTYKLDGVERVPYRLPELLAFPDATVFVTEGEKDADRVATLSLTATTVASGVWKGVDMGPLRGRHIIVLQDNDDAGMAKAQTAARALHGVAASVRVVLLPDLPPKGDVSDWLDADQGNADKLVDVCFAAPLWKPDTTAPPAPPSPPNDARTDPPAPSLPFIDMSNCDNEPVPEQEWAVFDRIPLRQCVLYSGEGAVGKSIELQHLCVAHVLARDWLGSMPEPGPAWYIEAEDDKTVIHRRLAAILKHYGTTFSDAITRGLRAISFAGQDAVLATASRSGKIEPTSLYKQLLESAGDIKPKMIGIASSANVYAGSEVDRSQVQQFVGMLTRVAIVANGSVVLASHPSLTGISSDSGLSGTTQWHNAVRARFYMKSVKPEAGEQSDSDLREIVFKKNQYGAVSANIVVRYQNGLFLPIPGMGSLDKLARDARADEIFLDELRRFASANRYVSDKKSPSYAPAVFAKEDAAKKGGITSIDLASAMRRLFAAKKIWNEPCGKPSRPAFRLAHKEV